MIEIAQAVAARVQRARGPDSNGWYSGCCPFHDDDHPSFAWTKDGFVCHGCGKRGPVRELADHLGIDIAAAGPEIISTYDYTDEKGDLVFQVVRKFPKGFLQRVPSGNGSWTWSTKGVRRLLYRLPEVLGAVREDQRVYIVEGEKDADRLQALGLIATTSPGGAGKWRSHFADWLRDRSVVILPDNDEAGRNHAFDIAASLAGHAADVRVLELPGLPEKGDVSDWLDAGNTPQLLEDLADKARPSSEVPTPVVSPVEHSTDLGNARRLVHRHGHELHHVHVWGRWYVWDGRRWAVDETREVERRAKETVRSIYEEAAGESDDAERRALARWAGKSESEARIRAMISLAQSEPEVVGTVGEFDRDPWKLNVLNGTVDLETGQLHPHRPADRITRLAPVNVDPSATAPTWLSFLETVMDGDQEKVRFLQRVVGYAMSGSTREEKLFVLYGVGANGKTTLIETVRHLMGDYAMQTPTETLMYRRDRGIPNDLARLRGARLVSAAETDVGRSLAEGVVKQLTGGDTVTARFLHREYFEFAPEFKLFLGVNHKPRVRGTDDGIWRRICLIPFTVTIPPEDRDRELRTKLRVEGPGIFNWALRGCLRWQQDGLDEPQAVREATSGYRSDMDELGDFLEARCESGPNYAVLHRDLYDCYVNWCKRQGQDPESATKFGRMLGERGIERDRKGPRKAIRRLGVRLVSSPPLGSPQATSPHGTAKSQQDNELTRLGHGSSDELVIPSVSSLVGEEVENRGEPSPTASDDEDDTLYERAEREALRAGS